MTRLTLILAIAISYFTDLHGQPNIYPNNPAAQFVPQALKVGDKVPNVRLQVMEGSQTRVLDFSQLSGKLVILDFWNRWCSSCIRSFPKMQALQERFGSNIKIILVTNDTEAALSKLFKASPNLKNNKLPMIIGDSVLHKLFPHAAVPYHVWISPTGIVEFTTAGWNTTEQTIASYLKGDKPKIESVSQPLTKNQLGLPLFKQMSIYEGDLTNEMLTYSLITRKSRVEIRSMWGYAFIDSTDNIDNSGITLLNQKIIGLFSAVHLANKGKIHIKTIIELKHDSNMTKYYPPVDPVEKIGWDDENTYCYEAKIPRELSGGTAFLTPEKLEYVKVDIERYFHIKSSVQKRTVPCYVLQSLPGFKPEASKFTVSVMEKDKNNNYTVRKGGTNSICTILENEFGDYAGPDEIPVLNEVPQGSIRHFDFDLTLGTPKSLNQLNNSLRKYGLFVKKEVRETECLVLTEQ